MSTPAAGPAIGFIGLGIMGAPMARHILAAGAPLHVTARRPESASALVADGAQWWQNAREVAAASDVVVLMVPDLPQVEELLDGPDGLLAGARGDGLLVVVCSTVSPDGVRSLASRVATQHGSVRFVDAPVSGGEEGATAATLSIMAGGADEDVALASRVLAPCGRVVHLGPLGSGQVAKACNQMVVAAAISALGEAAVVAERAGMDLAALFDVLGGGYAASRILEVKADRFVRHDHTPTGPAKYMVKDLGFARDEAARSGTVTPLLDVLHQVFSGLTANGMGDSDTSVVQAYVESLGRADA